MDLLFCHTRLTLQKQEIQIIEVLGLYGFAQLIEIPSLIKITCAGSYNKIDK